MYTRFLHIKLVATRRKRPHRNNFIIPFLFLIQWSFAQTTVLSGNIKGLNTPQVTLAYYIGGEAFVRDSTLVDTVNGTFKFRVDGLKPGMFVLFTEKGRLFNFILSTTPDSLVFTGDVKNLENVTTGHDSETETHLRFVAALKPIEDRVERSRSMYEMVSNATRDREALDPIEKQIVAGFGSIDSLTKIFMAQHPNHLFARMLKSITAPETPANIIQKENGRTTATYFYWLRKHYWDHTDFNDERLINNNLWQSYFDGYFRKMVAPGTDSLLQAIDQVIGLMPKNGAFYQFAIKRITNNVDANDAPGADVVFVHMADKYLSKNNAPWMDVASLERVAYKAEVNRPVLTGLQAPPLILSDEQDVVQDLHKIDAPLTMLIFYSPLCSHCMEIMPTLYQLYLDFQSTGMQVVAVNTDEQYGNWKQFQKQQNWAWIDLADPSGKNEFEKQYITFNLPVIYLLDKDKKILQKRPPIENLREILLKMLKK